MLASDPPQDAWKARGVQTRLAGAWATLRDRLAHPEPEPEPLAWDEVFDAAAAAYCRSEASRKALQLCFQTRQQTTQVSIGWTANELMAFAKTIKYIYPAPPQREWQSLTDEEIDKALWENQYPYLPDIIRIAEAKLKEKNT
jgi:hypothetical protein